MALDTLRRLRAEVLLSCLSPEMQGELVALFEERQRKSKEEASLNDEQIRKIRTVLYG